MISFACSNCKAMMNVEDHLAGKSEVCPKCGAFQQVPDSEEEPPSVFGRVLPKPPPPSSDAARPASASQVKLGLMAGAAVIVALLFLGWLLLRK